MGSMNSKWKNWKRLNAPRKIVDWLRYARDTDIQADIDLNGLYPYVSFISIFIYIDMTFLSSQVGLSVRLRDIGINIMGSIIELESLLEEQRARVSAERTIQREVRKKEQRLTFEQQMLRDYGRTIKIRTGLAQEEFEYILHLLRKLPEPVRRGRKLLDLDIRLVMFMQWLKFGQSYEQVAQSFHIKKSRVQTAISDLWTPMIETLTQNLLPKKTTGLHAHQIV